MENNKMQERLKKLCNQHKNCKECPLYALPCECPDFDCCSDSIIQALYEFAFRDRAYKNGYEAGVREFADKIFEEAPNITPERSIHLRMEIFNLAMRLISNNREEKGR